ncbi:Ger(x)C family spore germination protein [Paenibacillus sp. LMG 31460]|uniref:Ger(X)C family spore germination protein n=2 Tax=Paenibacillus germinis TaxID=2654979 RepID=A0ABX1Z1C8_9BACL|nr:Ger(x)C family spore germination protein [Paenibacillus germinis]
MADGKKGGTAGMRRILLLWLIAILPLSGCNYHNELKNLQLIYATSLDMNDKNEIVTTVTIQTPGGKERSAPVHEVLSATGPTLQESLFKKIGMQIAGPIGTSKNQVMLIGEKLARKDLTEILDSTFRNSNDPMLAKVAIVRGNASGLIRLDRIGSATAGEYLRKILKSAKYETAIPSVTLHSLYPVLHDQGRDSVIPLISRLKDKAVVDGVALMNQRKYTGYFLTPEQSSLFLLMSGLKGNICVITRNMEESGSKNDPSQYLSLNILKLKRNKHVWVDAEGQIRVQLHLKMKASVVEYTKDDLADKQKIIQLNKHFSELLTHEAQDICKLLLRSRSDAFGIGRDIMAFYPNEWKRMNWETVYPETDFQVSTEVDIVSHGIIN